MFKPTRNYHSNTSLLDMLFNMILFLIVILGLAILQIQVETSKAKIESKAEYIITLTWDDDSTDDVDLWVKDPSGSILYFGQPEKNLMHLDRDDLGYERDTIYDTDGNVIKASYNQEIATIRGYMAGEWIVNIHMYYKRWDKPSTIHVKIEKLNPQVKLITMKQYIITQDWDQKTVLRFTMDSNGNIIHQSELQYDMVSLKIARLKR